MFSKNTLIWHAWAVARWLQMTPFGSRWGYMHERLRLAVHAWSIALHQLATSTGGQSPSLRSRTWWTCFAKCGSGAPWLEDLTRFCWFSAHSFWPSRAIVLLLLTPTPSDILRSVDGMHSIASCLLLLMQQLASYVLLAWQGNATIHEYMVHTTIH